MKKIIGVIISIIAIPFLLIGVIGMLFLVIAITEFNTNILLDDDFSDPFDWMNKL